MTTRDGPYDGGHAEPTVPTDGGADRTPSLDTVFDVLSNARRRFTLYHLTKRGSAVALPELATRIAAWEDDVVPDAVGSERVDRVLASLVSVHVPKLTAADFVAYDEEAGTVTSTARTEHIRPYLQLSERADF